MQNFPIFYVEKGAKGVGGRFWKEGWERYMQTEWGGTKSSKNINRSNCASLVSRIQEETSEKTPTPVRPRVSNEDYLFTHKCISSRKKKKSVDNIFGDVLLVKCCQ